MQVIYVFHINTLWKGVKLDDFVSFSF